MRIRLEATDLPGRGCAPGPDGNRYENIHVAVQRRNRPAELLDPHPGDAPTATWTLDCTLKNGEPTGPYIQGGPGNRFIYLSWGAVTDDDWGMFRRAKIFLSEIPVTLPAENATLVAHLTLTDPLGHPLCAPVTPPHITWTTEPPVRDHPAARNRA